MAIISTNLHITQAYRCTIYIVVCRTVGTYKCDETTVEILESDGATRNTSAYHETALAETLSRQPCPGNKTIELDVQISHVQFSTRKLDELRRETRNDSEIQKLLKVIVDGWPDRQRDVHPQLRPFWPYRDELVTDDGIVLKGNRIVMPASLQAETLVKLHESHQGIEKMHLRARSCVFWNGINNDIEVVLRKCATCQEVQRAQLREPLMPHDTPSRAWQIVGTDLFVINRETYLHDRVGLLFQVSVRLRNPEPSDEYSRHW